MSRPKNFAELVHQAKTAPDFDATFSRILGVRLNARKGASRFGGIVYKTTTKQGVSDDYSSLTLYHNPNGLWIVKDPKGRYDGDPIAVVQQAYNMSFDDAVYFLTGTSAETPEPVRSAAFTPLPEQKEKTEFKPLTPGSKNSRAIAYLVKTRCLPYDIVVDLIRQGKIFESPINPYGKNFPCCVFNIKDENGRLVGQQWRSVLSSDFVNESSKKYQRGNVTGSDGSYGWYFNYKTDTVNKDTPVMFCEAAIDAISLCALIEQPGVYVSMGGLQSAVIDKMLPLLGSKNAYICVDNDEAGRRFTAEHPDFPALVPRLDKVPEQEKKDKADWNDNLKFAKCQSGGAETKTERRAAAVQ